MRELALRVPADALEEVLDELMPLAPHGVFELARGEDVELRVRAPADAGAVAAVAAQWGAALDAREVADDWRERRVADHEPLVVAGRLAVRPDWAPAPAAGLLDVVLAGEGAFGAGTHPTTRWSLEALCALEPGGAFADLGCGSGVLAIAAARLGWAPVTAVDAEPQALDAARANAARNGVAVEVRAVDLMREPPPAAAAIAANVPLEVHVAIAARMACAPGALIASGVLDEAAERVRSAYAAAGLRVARRTAVAGWAVLVLTPR